MYEEVKARSRAVWGTGDYGPTSRQLEPAAVGLVDALDITHGMTVLDVAAGHGNCAIAAARRGAMVVATDFSPRMVEIGSERTHSTGLPIDWQEADAANLPFADDSFDAVTSTFGAIFAPEQEQVAAEIARVLRPHGRAGLTAWTPDGITAQVLEVNRELGPPRPADTPDPFRWGNAEEVHGMFEPLGCGVQATRRALTVRYASWEHWSRDSDAHGMAVVTRQMMGPDAYAEMRARVRAVTAEHSYGEGDAVVFDADYLELIISKAA